jgi:xanthine dehydrogenase YagR molybdenum-binding subunit
MSTPPFPDRARFDALDKVRGAAIFAADIPVDGLLYAMTVSATIAKGRMTGLSIDGALAVPGVVRVLAPDDFPDPLLATDQGPAPPPPTLVTEIAYRGQPIALVVAQTLEAAIEGATAIRPVYEIAEFSALIDSEGHLEEPFGDVVAGDADAALASAATVVEAAYDAPAQHHNPIEMVSTTAIWRNGRLTIFEGTQHSRGVKDTVAQALRIDPGIIDVISGQVGGSFGQKGSPSLQSALIARAAILTGQPVKMVVPRGQLFHTAKFRPRSRHRVTLGADAAGRMIAVRYHADHQQSRGGDFGPRYHNAPSQLYGIKNYLGTAANIRIDTQPSGEMRCPHPQPALFAFESAVDELALRLGQDPVAFRLAHDTRTDPINGRPLSSRFLHECIREGAQRFGWERRTPEPGSMTLPDGTLVGWGMACGSYPCLSSPAIATLRIGADGRTRFAIGGHEMGQGMRTAIAAVVLEGLDIDPERLEILLGDTTVAPQHITAGSWGTASVAPVAAKAVESARAAMADLLDGRVIAGNLHRQLATVRRPFVQVEVSAVPHGLGSAELALMRRTGDVIAGPQYPAFTTYSYIAHFVEVHIEPRTRRIRVPRVVTIADCGRVISPRTSASQLRGGVVWAISAALRESSEIDPRYGGWLNNDLADYVVAVNADIGEIDVGFIDQPDPLFNDIGAKGVGEVAMAGAAGAIANAIHHATGRRVRHMPILVEDLL